MSDGPATEPFEIPAGRRRGRDLFLALRAPKFGLYAGGQLASSSAVWVQRIVQDWVVLELTGSAAMVGVLVMFQFGPTLLLGMWGGVIVDRRSTRSVLLVTQAGAAIVAVALTVLAFADALTAPLIYGAVVVVGLFSLVDQPARQVFVGELVGGRALPNAISMNSTIFQVSTMVGPAIGGLLIPIGAPWAFLTGAILALIGLGTLFAVGQPSFPRERAPRGRGQIVEALRYCARKPGISWTLCLLLFVALIGLNWPVLLTSMADRVFASGGTGYGLYTSAVGVGALAGALLSLRRTGVRLRTVYGATGAFMTFKVVSAASPSQVFFVVAIALAGCCSILMWTAANTMLQSSSNRAIRGRVMSLYLLIAVGGQALGGPLLGWIIEHFGARTGMALSGGIPLLAVILLGFWWALRRRSGLRV